MKKAGSVILFILFIAVSGFAGVSFKLMGGMSYLLENDYNKGVQGTYDYYQANFNDITGKYGPLRTGMYFGGEIIVPIGQRLSVGLGVGYFQASQQSDFGYTWLSITATEIHEPKIRVIPLALNLHCIVPLGRDLCVDLYAGPGYFLMTFDDQSSLKTNFFSYEQSQTFHSRKSTWGGQAGIGFEWAFTSFLSLILNVEGRYAIAADIKGDWKKRESWFLGTAQEEASDAFFWYYEQSEAGRSYPQIGFAKNQPSNSSYFNIRRGEINLSGISLVAGIKITF